MAIVVILNAIAWWTRAMERPYKSVNYDTLVVILGVA